MPWRVNDKIMCQAGNNKRLLLSVSLVVLGAVFLLMGLLPRQSESYIECSPVIGVTNYQYFAVLLKNIVQDRLVARLRLYLMEKINIEFMPGNFTGGSMGSLKFTTDFSSIAGGVEDEWLALQTGYVMGKMSPEVFREYLNSAVRTIVQEELLRKGFDRRHVQGVMSDYEKQFLNSRQTFKMYTDQARAFQTMVREFLKESTKLASGMTSLAGKIDVADWVQGKQGIGGNANTFEMLKECEGYTKNGLKNIGAIAGIEIGDVIGGTFSSANSQYLRARLIEIGNIDKTVSLSAEEIEKIIAHTNKAALCTVRDYIESAIAGLNDMTVRINDAFLKSMKKAIGGADSMIHKAMSREKEEGLAASRLYAEIEKEVKGLISNSRKCQSIASESKQISLLNNDDIKKITTLLAGRNTSMSQRRLAVKHYIVARESKDVADSVRTRLLNFDPAAIDRQYGDMAWKDLARFNYYLLVIHNQKMKLLALRAMSESWNTADPETVRYITGSGLPKGF